MELRAFALTLHYYSPSAYNFVREEFNKLLPHPDTIREWYMVVEGAPGFTKESFVAIKSKVEEEGIVILNLTVDEMSIRQMVQYVQGVYYGYVDLGMETKRESEDEKDEARNALVFMGVSLKSHWKIPLGYFLINSLSASERSRLLKKCLELIKETGAMCRSLTFDGAAVNMSMVKELGALYDYPNNFQPWFFDPNAGVKVHTFLDACHLIKLIRNAFGDRKVFYDSNGNAIEWAYIEKLQQLETREGLRCGTKLTPRHTNFQNEKMKVSYAVQTQCKCLQCTEILQAAENSGV